MQVLDEEKRERILQCAGEQFASQPYHRVVLSAVAAAANVGKGTLYTYFDSKEALYLGVMQRGFAELVSRLEDCLAKQHGTAPELLRTVIAELVQFAWENTAVFELMRHVPVREDDSQRWMESRRKLTGLLCGVIAQGVSEGAFHDPHPELTAKFIPGMVRASFLDRTDRQAPDTVAEHINFFVVTSLTQKA